MLLLSIPLLFFTSCQNSLERKGVQYNAEEPNIILI
jgi:hypothetical protein